MDKHTLTHLFNKHYRANRWLWRSVMALSETQFNQPLDGEQVSIRTLIVSMVAHENLWVNYLWHHEVEFLRESQFPTRASIREEWDALEEEILDFIGELSPADLESRVEPPFLITGTSLQISEILLQIISHANKSRAQMCLHLDGAGSLESAQQCRDLLIMQRYRFSA